MELNPSQIAQLIKRLPSFELSYETIPHKKVPSTYDVCLAIPQAKKFYAWFTFHKDADVCFIMEITREKKIGKIYIAQTLFNPALSKGTLVYGSLLEDSSALENTSLSVHIPSQPPSTPVYSGLHKKHAFLVEDMLFYKGISLKNTTFGKKLGFIHEFMEKTIVQKFADTEKNTIYNIAFYLPMMWGTDPTFHENHESDYIPDIISNKITYPVHHIQYRCLNQITPFLNVFSSKKPNIGKESASASVAVDVGSWYIDKTTRFIPDYLKPQYNYKTVFQVCADLQYDIYHLYALGTGGAQVYYNVAYIPNYPVSVLMNGLFRNIKENQNLDYIEESDDEDDFQDARFDKYVDLKKTLLIECVFQRKFKRWIPLRVVDKREAESFTRVTDSKSAAFDSRLRRPSRVVHISKLIR